MGDGARFGFLRREDEKLEAGQVRRIIAIHHPKLPALLARFHLAFTDRRRDILDTILVNPPEECRVASGVRRYQEDLFSGPRQSHDKVADILVGYVRFVLVLYEVPVVEMRDEDIILCKAFGALDRCRLYR